METVLVAIGVAAFAMRFNERGTKIIYAVVAGLVCWLTDCLMLKAGCMEYISCYVSVGVLTIFSECMARIIKTPVSVILVPALIPMIPGESLYVAMNNLMNKNMDVFVEKGTHTLVYSTCIAVGIVSATVICHLVIMCINNLKKYT